MLELRVFRLGETTSTIVVRGELDVGSAARVGDEIALCRREGTVIVDLLDVHAADARALDLLLPQLRRDDVIVVAERRIVGNAEVPLKPTLAAALT